MIDVAPPHQRRDAMQLLSPFWNFNVSEARFHRTSFKHSAQIESAMAASWITVPWSSPRVSNWCAESHRGIGEERFARIAPQRLRNSVWSGREAARSTLLRMASAEVSGASASSAPASSSPTSLAAPERQEKEAADMVQEFYGAINRREISSIGDLFADDCIYEDLVFPKPFVGRKAITDFFQKFMDSVGSELTFKVDDITTGDPNAAGVVWHLEWKGKPFPFSKGCSFYRCQVLNGKRQIVYGRDAVEPATKPGDLTLVALKGVAALLRRFPSLADRF